MSERLLDVAGRLDVQPGDRILEIGCGQAEGGPGGTLLCVFDEPNDAALPA